MTGEQLTNWTLSHQVTGYRLAVHILGIPPRTCYRWMRGGVPPTKKRMVRGCLRAYDGDIRGVTIARNINTRGGRGRRVTVGG